MADKKNISRSKKRGGNVINDGGGNDTIFGGVSPDKLRSIAADKIKSGGLKGRKK